MAVKKYKRWDRLGINPGGYALAEMLCQPIETALMEMKRTASASHPESAVDDLAFIAKQVVWDTAERIGMIGKKRASPRRARRES